MTTANRWALAPSAILTRYHLESPLLLGGREPGDAARDAARERLDEDFDVGSPAAARAKLDALAAGAKKKRLAFDVGRVAFVAGKAHLAGFLGEDEAWAACLAAARKLQAAFASWEDFGERFLDGDERPALRHVFRALVLEGDGPWSIDWGTAL